MVSCGVLLLFLTVSVTPFVLLFCSYEASPASKRKGTFISDQREKIAEEKLKARVSFPLSYKFHEGFTNAVRRVVLVKDFL